MSIKSKLASWQIDKKLRRIKRTIHVINLENVQTTGVLWNCEDQAVYSSLVAKLKEKNISVSGFCFSDRPISIKGEAVFNKQDFNWLGQPKSKKVLDFIHTKFDLLIDISLSEKQEAQAVRALSLAKFKAGWASSGKSYFDLGIDIRKQQEPNYLAEQIIYYLNRINKSPISK